MIRRLAVALIALVVAVQVVRTAVVEAMSQTRPDLAAKAWRGHPDVELSSGMLAIATATRDRKPVGPAVFDQIYDAAAKAPLAPEPYLVHGVQAELTGQERVAEQAFLAAKWRDGRSLPARYFLADLYLRRGDAKRGLGEIGGLARLAPNGITSLAPYVATYARDRSNWARLRALFRSEPALEDTALQVLSRDASNADLVLALSDPKRRGPTSPWLEGLLSSLIGTGQYGKARSVWAGVAGVRLDANALVFDPGFTEADAPPPFNWLLTSSTVGLAERTSGGLHVIFYGQEDGTLASEMLVLPPGRYRLATRGSMTPRQSGSLRWNLACASNNSSIASVPLSAAMAREWLFEVPVGCAGQRLELVGSSTDVPQQSEATVRAINLVREPASG